MPKLKAMIPIEFYNLKKAKKPHHPKVRNVGQLITQLQRLPKALRVESEWGGHPELVVYNVSLGDPHLRLRESED